MFTVYFINYYCIKKDSSTILNKKIEGGHNVKSSLAYITVGTGCGIGLIINGKTVHGLVHPEGGHMKYKKNIFN